MPDTDNNVRTNSKHENVEIMIDCAEQRLTTISRCACIKYKSDFNPTKREQNEAYISAVGDGPSRSDCR